MFGNTVVTGLADDWPLDSDRAEALKMGELMSDRWANLAKYGNPNGDSAADAAGP